MNRMLQQVVPTCEGWEAEFSSYESFFVSRLSVGLLCPIDLILRTVRTRNDTLREWS